MDDLSLEDLQAALQTVQNEKSAIKLSDRNVVELVNKLQECGLLGGDLLHTVNGREYVTADHLKTEVIDTVSSTGGRIAVVNLPAQLAVDLLHCEHAAQQAVAESNGQLRLVQGELITVEYFDNLAAEIDEILQAGGVVPLATLAAQFTLGSELLMSVVTARINKTIHGRLEGGLLYTSAYIARIKSQMRGGLRGAASPVNIPHLLKRIQLDDLPTGSNIVSNVIDELIKEGSIRGVLRGGGSSFTPAIYAKSQQEAVKRFYEQNNYIGYDTVAKLGIAASKQHLQTTFPDGIALESAFVSPSVIHQLDASAEDAAASGSWCDVQALLPPALSHEDASALLEHCPIMQSAGKTKGSTSACSVHAGTCIVSTALQQELQQQLLSAARQAAETAQQDSKAASKSAATSEPSPGQAPKPDSSKSGGAAATADSDDDDWDMSKTKGGKGKKAGKKKTAGKAKGSAQAASAASKQRTSKASKPTDAAACSALTVHNLTDQILELYPDMEGAGTHGKLAQALATCLRPAVLAEFDKAMAAVFVAGAESRRRRRDLIAHEAQDSWQHLQLYLQGCQLFADEEGTSTALQRHLVRTTATSLLDWLLHYQDVDNQEEAAASGPSSQDQSSLPAVPMSLQDRQALLARAPPDLAPALKAAADTIGNTADAQSAQQATQAAAEAVGLRLKPLDKKAEKALVQAQQDDLQAQLADHTDPAAVLSLVVPLLVMQVRGKAITVPGRALAGIIAGLRTSLESDSFELLQSYHQLVVNHLRAMSAETPSEPELGVMQEQLATKLQAIKSMAGVRRK
ncbi:hypothetical protein ABBQ32_001414 [Trebouxia sp. C0010 RCD-2024]